MGGAPGYKLLDGGGLHQSGATPPIVAPWGAFIRVTGKSHAFIPGNVTVVPLVCHDMNSQLAPRLPCPY